MRNIKLYNAAGALVEASKFVTQVDEDYAQQLLDKAEEFKNQIVIDENLEKEINDFKDRISM